MNKIELLDMITRVTSKAFQKDVVISSFKRTGICPLNMSQIPTDAFLPSNITEKEKETDQTVDRAENDQSKKVQAEETIDVDDQLPDLSPTIVDNEPSAENQDPQCSFWNLCLTPRRTRKKEIRRKRLPFHLTNETYINELSQRKQNENSKFHIENIDYSDPLLWYLIVLGL